MAKKVTKKETYLSIIEKYGMTGDDKDFILHEIELLDKRYDRKSDKPTKKQTENEAVKTQMVDYITDAGDAQFTATDLATACNLSSAQKASALLKQLVDEGVLAKAIIKRRAYFALPDHEFVEPVKEADASEAE